MHLSTSLKMLFLGVMLHEFIFIRMYSLLQRLRWPLAAGTMVLAGFGLIGWRYTQLELQRSAYYEHVTQALQFCEYSHFSGVLRETRAMSAVAQTSEEEAYAQELLRRFRMHECELPPLPKPKFENTDLMMP